MFLFACNQGAETKKTDETISEEKIFENTEVAVYYFYGKMRCATCIDLQKFVEKTVEDEFSDNDKVKYFEIDVSEKSNQEIADKYEISFSSVILATKDNQVNLTMEAFDLLYKDPNTLKELIINETNNFLTN